MEDFSVRRQETQLALEYFFNLREILLIQRGSHKMNCYFPDQFAVLYDSNEEWSIAPKIYSS